MSIGRFVLNAALCAVIAAASSVAYAQADQANPQAPSEPKAPKIWIEATTHDFGTVEAGTPLRYSFKIRNDGTAALEIKGVRPSCGCTTTDFDKQLAPGAEGKITLAVEHTGGYSGETQKVATVTTNDPLQPSFGITLHMFFKAPAHPPDLGTHTMTPTPITKVGHFMVSPGNEWTTAAVRGTSISGTLQILNQGDKPARVTNVAPGGTSFGLNLRTVEEGKSYALVITTSPDLKAGQYKQTARLTTDDKDAPEIPIELAVTIYPLVVAAPMKIHLSDLSLEPGARQIQVPTIYLNKVHGDGLAVKSVTTDLPFLVIEPKAEVEGRRYTIHLSVDRSKLPGPGVFKGKVHVVTNDEEVPTLDITIDGTFY